MRLRGDGGGGVGASCIKNAESRRPNKNDEGRSTRESFSLLEDIRLLESARRKRIASENGGRNNPRRNNATRQIVSAEILVSMYIPLKIQWLHRILRREPTNFQRDFSPDISLHFSKIVIKTRDTRSPLTNKIIHDTYFRIISAILIEYIIS